MRLFQRPHFSHSRFEALSADTPVRIAASPPVSHHLRVFEDLVLNLPEQPQLPPQQKASAESITLQNAHTIATFLKPGNSPEVPHKLTPNSQFLTVPPVQLSPEWGLHSCQGMLLFTFSTTVNHRLNGRQSPGKSDPQQT
ncbi:hypothetical protein A6X21_06500 [Planctopirus hydrillae]|uniref:Uncharacterized protein n=1 Tax=Planctopirus hydrillae TaxID=1841610 RepID=A0A1C3E9S3_9PLAN|nr:hypothetical protein A6X21_06500 [Planctopirus hydrillae]